MSGKANKINSFKEDLLGFQEMVKEKFPYNQYRKINEAVGELRYYYIELEGKKYLSFESNGVSSGPIKGKISANARLGYVLGIYYHHFESNVNKFMEEISYAEDFRPIIDKLAEIIERYL